MTTTTSTGSTTAASGLSAATAASGGATTSTDFLALLVTQLQNQDPLNPMDNAEMTSQLAQLNTVDQLEQLNGNVTALDAQFLQLQTLQSANLVGKDVAIEGDDLRVSADGVGEAGFELASAADEVEVQIYSAGGVEIGELTLKDLPAGRHEFTWEVPEMYRDQELTFKVKATGDGKEVSALSLQTETVTAVSAFGDELTLELANGNRVTYDAVWTFL